jgi:hypothetical protein
MTTDDDEGECVWICNHITWLLSVICNLIVLILNMYTKIGGLG